MWYDAEGRQELASKCSWDLPAHFLSSTEPLSRAENPRTNFSGTKPAQPALPVAVLPFDIPFRSLSPSFFLPHTDPWEKKAANLRQNKRKGQSTDKRTPMGVFSFLPHFCAAFCAYQVCGCSADANLRVKDCKSFTLIPMPSLRYDEFKVSLKYRR